MMTRNKSTNGTASTSSVHFASFCNMDPINIKSRGRRQGGCWWLAACLLLILNGSALAAATPTPVPVVTGITLRFPPRPAAELVTGYRFYQHLADGSYKSLGTPVKMPEWAFKTVQETAGKRYACAAINAGGEGPKSADVPGLPLKLSGGSWMLKVEVKP